MNDMPGTGKSLPPDATVMGASPARQEYDIILKPVSHPELGEIRIEDELFPIGRTEPPFVNYPPAAVAELSRRHARIFSETGAVYIADLDSKNGTSLNGRSIRQQICRLRNGDEICFGRSLIYRAQLIERQQARHHGQLDSLTLSPDQPGVELLPIVINRFPFLIGKTDAAFARYKTRFPEEVTYLSRRHAHIFLKGGEPWLEDLGSVNGSFLDGQRLEEHAVPLREGCVVGFGGHHFVYRVHLQLATGRQSQAQPSDPTLTQAVRTGQAADPTIMPAPATAAPSAEAAASDKTTFVAAADSFLDIFCVDAAAQQEEQAAEDAGPVPPAAEGTKKGTKKGRKKGRAAALASELGRSFGGWPQQSREQRRWVSLALVGLVVLAFGVFMMGAPKREVRELLAHGQYALAAQEAQQQLARNPEQPELRAMGTEAMLKAGLPDWLAGLKARDFGRVDAALEQMQENARHNPDAAPLLAELDWITQLEKYLGQRGGVDAQVRIFADEDRIRGLLSRWDENTQEHQRAVVRITSFVPDFRDPYAEVLSHLRRLQNDDSVYVTAIERLKTNLNTELERGRPDALEPMLKETAERYPRLAGLDRINNDLRLYLAIQGAAQERQLGRLSNALSSASMTTPPFQNALQKLAANGQIPSREVVSQYQNVAQAWRTGATGPALDGLQKISAGPWQDAVSADLAHKKKVAQQYAALQGARGSKDYGERLLDFFGGLDPQDDVFFVRATESDIEAYKERALKRGADLALQAQTLWRRYRDNGAIEGGQRLESGISARFRSQARLLSDAGDASQASQRIHRQLKAEYPEQWSKTNGEIHAELDTQRRSLQELQRVLEPGLLRAKLALLGGDDESRKSTKAPE